jgi:hypothetical protein
MVIISASGPFAAYAEGVRDFADGWLLNPGDMELILSRSGPWDPANEGLDHVPLQRSGWGLWVGAGQGRLFSMRDLPLKSVECGILQRSGPLPWSLACSWERLGEELMVEETCAMRLRLGGNPQTGVRVRARRWLVAGEQMATSLETSLEGRLSFGMGARLTGNIAFWLHPGNLPDWHGRGGRRTLAEIKFFHPGSGLALRIDQRGDGVPVLSLEIMGRLTPGLGLGFRADPETGSLGGNLVVRLGGLWLHTSHLVHPSLGLTHRFHLGTGDPGASVW